MPSDPASSAPKPHAPAAVRTPMRRHPSFDLSVTGIVYITTMFLMGVAAINGQINLLFGVFGLMAGVMLVSGLICWMVLRRVRMTRLLPEQCFVGRPTTVIYQFKNQKRFWPSLSLTLLEMEGAEAFESQPAAYLLHAAAGMTASVPVSLLPKRRGRYALGDYQLSTSFPFGFIKRALSRCEPDQILICPALGRASKQLLGLCRCDQRADAPIRPRRGGQDEFYGVKEHRLGENPRWIYWRRSARTPGILIAKEMTQVAPPRLLLLVDTYLQHADLPEKAAVEKTLAMAATLASEALDQGLSVGLCVWGGTDWTVTPIQQGKRQRRDLLAALACVPANRTAESSALLDAATGLIRQGTTAVLFTPRQMAITLSDHLRGNLVVVSARSPWIGAWFSFDESIDFERCIPLESDAPPPVPRPTPHSREPALSAN
jgi:uncharacterized protein (DUF58 family)